MGVGVRVGRAYEKSSFDVTANAWGAKVRGLLRSTDGLWLTARKYNRIGDQFLFFELGMTLVDDILDTSTSPTVTSR